MNDSGRIVIRLVKSPIGAKEEHKRTLRALGLRKLGQEVTKTDGPVVRGMASAVTHLVEIVEQGS
ncbi:MAG: 50S ribosomal protein L30 [Anaerolineae bacterium]|nr:50S ribosomal protein L30 [Anaerolineae bacterium]